MLRIEEHADRHEEEDGKGVAHRQRFGRGAHAELRAAHDQAGQKGSERHRHAEELRRRHGDAERHDEHREREQLPGPCRRDARQDPWHEPPSADENQGGQRRHFDRCQSKADRHAGIRRTRTEDDGHQYQHEDGQQVFDDQPADGNVAGACMEIAIVREHANQHDRAGHRQCDPEHEPLGRVPAEQPRDDDAQQSGRGALTERSGHGDAPDRDQLLDVELQAHTEHQQDDPHLGELLREMLVGDEARRVRPDEKPGHQIPQDG